MMREIVPTELAPDHRLSLAAQGVVYVVEQDSSMCALLHQLLSGAGMTVRTLVCYAQFWREWQPQIAGCLIISPQAGLDGGALMGQLALSHSALPVIYFGPCSDVRMAVRAMKAGAQDFVVSPAEPEAILSAVTQALSEDGERRRDALAAAQLAQRYATLSGRERQVFSLVVTGLMNKHMADQLCLSESSIKIYRSNVMKKMAAKTLVDLVRMHQLLKLGSMRQASQYPSL